MGNSGLTMYVNYSQADEGGKIGATMSFHDLDTPALSSTVRVPNQKSGASQPGSFFSR